MLRSHVQKEACQIEMALNDAKELVLVLFYSESHLIRNQYDLVKRRKEGVAVV